MIIYNLLIAALWLIFMAYWALAAFGAKRTINSGWVWWRVIGVRLAIFVLVLIVLRITSSNRSSQDARSYVVNTNIQRSYAGAMLCALCGIRPMVSRPPRSELGIPTSPKENPDFATTAPDGYVQLSVRRSD